MAPTVRISREIYVPQFENGSLHYIMMGIIAASDFDSGWAVKAAPQQTFPVTTVASTVPSTVSYQATSGIGAPAVTRGGLQFNVQSWARPVENVE